MAFLTGWLYRKPITLSRASGAVTNYQMKLLVGESSGATGEDVDCAAHVKTDFSDLRFTAADGTTLLDYWIESVTGTTPNQLATVWIEFGSIGTGATTFYMYYGNAGAAAVSNIVNTFIKGDDFEWGANGDNLNTGSKITWTTANGSVVSMEQEYTGVASNTRSGKIPYHASGASATMVLVSAATQAIRFRIFKENATDCNFCVHGNGTKRIYLNINATEDLQYYSAGYVDTTKNVTADAWSLIEINNINFAAGTYDIYLDGVLAKSGAAMDTSSGQNGIVGFYGNASVVGADYWLDDYIVRNWVATEPAWGSWGAEETNIQHYTLALESASFSMTGAALRLLNNKKIIASPGAFSMIGADMGMPKTLVPFSLEPGAFAMTGAALSIRRPVIYMRMDPGAFAMVGAPVDIKYSWYDGKAAANYQFRKQRRTF